MSQKYVVSACLAGFACRYDGSAKPCPAIVALYQSGRAIPVCPESLSGLPAPRPPCEQTLTGVICQNGRDVTKEFELGAARALQKAQKSGCKKAILKARSPSCGIGQVYDGSFTGALRPGNGIFAQKLLDAGWQVMDEDEYLAMQAE